MCVYEGRSVFSIIFYRVIISQKHSTSLAADTSPTPNTGARRLVDESQLRARADLARGAAGPPLTPLTGSSPALPLSTRARDAVESGAPRAIRRRHALTRIDSEIARAEDSLIELDLPRLPRPRGHGLAAAVDRSAVHARVVRRLEHRALRLARPVEHALRPAGQVAAPVRRPITRRGRVVGRSWPWREPRRCTDPAGAKR